MRKIIKKIYGKIDYWKRTISVLYWCPNFFDKNLLLKIDYDYYEISKASSLPEILSDADIISEYKKRLGDRQIFCFLENDEGELVSYGWVNPSGNHVLGELDLEMNLGDHIDVLYDFNTLQNFRGKGLYPYLLQKICSRNEKTKLIYVFPDNFSSVKGIKKAGFQYLGNLRGFSKNNYMALIRKVCKE